MILAPGTLVLWSRGGSAVARHLFVVARILSDDAEKPTYRLMMTGRRQMFRWPKPPGEVAGRELVPLAAFGRRASVRTEPTGMISLIVSRDSSLEPCAIHPDTGEPWPWHAAWYGHHTDNEAMLDIPEAVDLIRAGLVGEIERRAA